VQPAVITDRNMTAGSRMIASGTHGMILAGLFGAFAGIAQIPDIQPQVVRAMPEKVFTACR
jgi:hypothetical protein